MIPAFGEFGIGYVKIAFQWSFYYLFSKTSYEAAMQDILSKGGDTDTNAAIVGGLLGAKGIDKIPPEWVGKVMDFKCDTEFSEVGRTRPEFLCPRYHLITLIKAICLNCPSQLKLKIKGEIVEDVESVLKKC